MNCSEIKKLLITAGIFTLVDSVYLTTTSPHFKSLIRNIQGDPLVLKLLPTFLCYIALVFGLYYFIIKDGRSYVDAGILGLVIYAVYEFTNKAIFDNWTWFTVLLDTTWGGILFASTTYLVYKIYGNK